MKLVLPLILLAALTFNAQAVTLVKEAPAQKIHLSWEAPTTYVDGSPLSPSDISHYKIAYWVDGNTEPTMIDNLTGLNHTMENVAPGNYTFAIMVYGTNSQSDWTDTKSKSIKPKISVITFTITVEHYHY